MPKHPKKPKLTRYPKKPKASASLETWKNFERRCKAVDAANHAKAAKYNKAVSDIHAAK